MRSLVLLGTLLVGLSTVVMLVGPPVYGARAGTGHPMLPRPQLLKVIAAGHLNFAADLYWLGLLQQAGIAHTAEDYKAISDYAQLVADLDPKFQANYHLAGLTIPFNLGREVWVNGEEALAIIDRGLKVFPDDLHLWFYRAHTCMFVLRDYPKAAESLQAAAKLPGAPPLTGLLATRVMAQAGQYDAAIAFAQTMMQTAQDPGTREYFARREKEIELERVLAGVDAATMQYWRREGSLPESIDVLLKSKDLPAPVHDPLGGTITLDAYGRARSTSTPFRLELYETDSKMLAPKAEDLNEKLLPGGGGP